MTAFCFARGKFNVVCSVLRSANFVFTALSHEGSRSGYQRFPCSIASTFLLSRKLFHSLFSVAEILLNPAFAARSAAAEEVPRRVRYRDPRR